MTPDTDEFLFLPLGGSGEIGMNLNLYGYGPAHNRQWIIVDIGVTFGGPDTPGVEIIMPDISYLEEIKDDILAIILTHGHEDHMGALARLWPRLQCPVYATPFTRWLVEDRLAEAGLLDDVDLRTVDLGERISLEPFDVELITLTHSIPEPNGLAIRTPAGLVLHTGDWKIDPEPEVGERVDAAKLQALGKEGILAMVCDSTNVFSPGTSGSEHDVRVELEKLIGEQTGKGVAVASFASNVARLESVMLAAKAANRSVCLIGRSMHRMVAAAKSVGLLSGLDDFITEDEAEAVPVDHVLYLCTGSQGEPRAALSRIANGDHRSVSFSKGDVVIFSSKIIPGNEKSIFALHNKLAEQGVDIITEKMRPIHVSGHPCRDELKQMYEWAKPHIAIPVHGERVHLREHVKLAVQLGVKHALAPHNGDMIKLSRSGARIIDEVPSGRWHEDGGYIVSDRDPSLRERKKMAYAGHVSIGVVMNAKGEILSGPEPRISGFPYGADHELSDELLDQIADEAFTAIKALSKSKRKDEDSVEKAIESKVKRLIRTQTGKRSLVEAIVLQV